MNDTSVFLSISEDFVDTFLPVGKGASPNTIKSYKYAFRLLIEYHRILLLSSFSLVNIYILFFQEDHNEDSLSFPVSRQG